MSFGFPILSFKSRTCFSTSPLEVYSSPSKIITHPSILGIVTWDGNALALECLYCQDRPIRRVSIIGPTSAIELFRVFRGRVKHGGIGTQSLIPPNKGRLFVEVSVKEICLIDIPFDLNKDDWSQILLDVGDDFGWETLHSRRLDPRIDVVGGVDALLPSELLPLLLTVEPFAHIVDLDVVDEGGQCRFCELLLDKSLAFLRVKTG